MRNNFLPLILVLGFFLLACGGIGSGGPGSLELSFDGVDKKAMEVKSGGFYVSTKTWSAKGKMTTSSSHFICVADHEIDLSSGQISIGKKVSEGQTKVCFSIDGAEGTDMKSTLKTGSYPMKRSSGSGFAYSSTSSASIRVL